MPPDFKRTQGGKKPLGAMLGNRKSVVALQLASRLCLDNYGISGGQICDGLEEIHTNKDPGKGGGKKSDFVLPRR